MDDQKTPEEIRADQVVKHYFEVINEVISKGIEVADDETNATTKYIADQYGLSKETFDAVVQCGASAALDTVAQLKREDALKEAIAQVVGVEIGDKDDREREIVEAGLSNGARLSFLLGLEMGKGLL